MINCLDPEETNTQNGLAVMLENDSNNRTVL